ncbi:Coiled-coil domain-containing protein 189 [Phytophthora ramorum]|uniref:Coiled-coil domain-containing protein 189 n=1 Tax=Phytophthora ramorum TaxID=164328 RepID=UPI0030AA7220|nr:Coiled-coil domain-containing protein 189 [Phytophthora ramorum]
MIGCQRDAFDKVRKSIKGRQFRGNFDCDTMTDAIVWRHATERELDDLATRHSVDDCKSALAGIFDLNPSDEKQSFLLDFHLHNYSFCRQMHFQLNQTSVFLGVCQTLMKRDFTYDSTTDFKSSFDFFQALLLTHSVERSPKSVKIFSRAEVAAIMDYVANSYYRHFQLYKCIYTPHYHVHLVQREINGIQTPKVPCPLSHGFLHSTKPVPPAESNGEVEAIVELSEPAADE